MKEEEVKSISMEMLDEPTLSLFGGFFRTKPPNDNKVDEEKKNAKEALKICWYCGSNP